MIQMIPGLERRLMTSSEEEIVFIADLVSVPFAVQHGLTRGAQIKRGASSARSDDTKSLKSAVLDWITPKGQPLNPPLARNVKIDRGFFHERTGALLCPAGVDWSNNESVHLFSRRSSRSTRHRTKEKLRNGDMIVTGDQWPILVYHGYSFDPEDPWNGLFRSSLLVTVRLVKRLQRC
jgi:hypothetical protein